MSVKLMGQVWELRLSPGQMLVALALADHGADDGSRIFPSLGRVAWKCGYSERQVRRVVRELEKAGIVVKVAEPCGGRGVEYRLDVGAGLPKPPFTPKRGGQNVRGGADICDTGGGQNFPGGRTPVSAEPSVEPSREPSHDAEASPLPPEARPEAAPGEVKTAFDRWARLCRPGSNVRLTEPRAKAYLSRRKRDGFTEEQLTAVIDAASSALALDEFDHPHWTSEFYRLFMDEEHVSAWLAYHETGDYCVLQEMLLTEEPR